MYFINLEENESNKVLIAYKIIVKLSITYFKTNKCQLCKILYKILFYYTKFNLKP